MTYAVRAAGGSGMSCEVTSTARVGPGTALVTTYLTDPDRDSVVIGTQAVVHDPVDRGSGRDPQADRITELVPSARENGDVVTSYSGNNAWSWTQC